MPRWFAVVPNGTNLERVATSGKLNVVLGEKGLAERVVKLL